MVKAKRKRNVLSWIKSHPLRLSIGTLVALFVAYQGYVNTGADSLRADVYQPLYSEVNAMDSSLEDVNNFQPGFSSQAFDALTRNGNLGRIPKSLREKIIALCQKAGEAQGHVIPVAHKISVLMPSAIQKIRTEADNKAWVEKALAQLNAESGLSSGSFPMASFSFRHAARSPALDLRDPQHPRIANPGIISWQVNDWMKFPQSAIDVAAIWQNTWFLGFDERNENWYYLVTHDDLARSHVELRDFLQPAYDRLAGDPDFQQLVQSDKAALDLLRQVRPLLADRVAHPKQIDGFDACVLAAHTAGNPKGLGARDSVFGLNKRLRVEAREERLQLPAKNPGNRPPACQCDTPFSEPLKTCGPVRKGPPERSRPYRQPVEIP